ncbi:LamG-like jellyroll fold domain-containing protein [Winogradskyella sp.]|uniref:LamG-like jellyroll fold domain-containing protein n=1 Tax=Winogradskyella sp. TaxID=1883156 RepID=UPI0025FC3B9C|nr:LamG-like jellyroll fold domain-containing protein [Winogradskyella sp.]
MKIFTSHVKVALCVVCFTLVNFSFSQKSGVWTASGSGSSTTWSATAGSVGITASATNYGSGTSYTLNDFVTYDTMGCNSSAYSDPSIVGNPSLSIRHTFPNSAFITFSFSAPVENPVMHFDRLGGGQVNNLTSSSIIKLVTPGITFTELAGNDVHFESTSHTVGRQSGQTYTSLPSECGPPNAGTASGSIRLNGAFRSVTFEISMAAIGGNASINDRWEIAFSDIEIITLDFDGNDDYVNRAAFLGNKSEVTMMTWIKLDAGFNGGEIMGQRNFRFFIDSNRRLRTYVKTNASSSSDVATPISVAPVLTTEMWYHVAAIYDANSNSIKMYLNGELEWKYVNLNGSALNNQASYNSDHDFEIGRNTLHDNSYFEGSIYETRVYNKALTDNQLQRQIYQEIENNSGNVRGKVIPKDIEGLSWSDLELYYKMDIVDVGAAVDDSSVGISGQLHNMRTYQDRTAPLPYVTKAGGNTNWDDKSNWLHGDVWDIDNHTACAIVKITKDIVTDKDHSTVGLIIDNGTELTVNNDSGIQNSWYLELKGEIDLQGESQLIQTEDSDLSIGSNGRLEKDQQGTKDLFTYNYWSSPVGVTSMIQNNVSFKYKLPNVMQNGTNPNSPNAISYVSGFDGSISGSNISISTAWIWKFANQADDDYSSWQFVGNTGDVNPGEGFTMKGVYNTNGSVSQEQNYVFNGKPNNGDIELDIDANNDYLIGNPYPSAMDAHQFILDNGPTIEGAGNTTGTLYFWEHWGGGSHVLQEYQGGYALYNLSGGTAAASKADIDLDVDQDGPIVGTKIPGRYIPVGQGFFVVGETSGKIKFNNRQRAFIKEGNSSSIFMRSANGSTINEYSDNSGDERMKIRIALNSINTIHRQLLVTVDENATMNYDWGFDGALNEEQVDDMYWIINAEKYVIQGINEIDEMDTALELGIKTNTEGINSITIDDLENIPSDLPIFLHDSTEEVYHNLRESDYSIALPAGEHLNRFEIVFSIPQFLSTIENELNKLSLYYAFSRNKMVILNPTNSELKNIELFNILGQSVYNNDNLWGGSYNEYEIQNLSTGTYVVKLSTVDNKIITKKIIVK